MSVTGPTMNLNVVNLKSPSEDEIKRMVYVLHEAFKNDTVFTNFLIGGDLKLLPQMLDATVRACVVGGEPYVVRTGPKPEDIICVAIWFGPGQGFLETDEQLKAGWNEFSAVMPKALQDWWHSFDVDLAKYTDSILPGPHYRMKNWHLHLFGVVPEHQKKGVGRTLMKTIEARAKADGASIILETGTRFQVEIYEHLGFKLTGGMPIENHIQKTTLFIITKDFRDE